MIITTPLFNSFLRQVCTPGARIVDIGGGLRAMPGKGNRHDPALSWALPLLAQADYKILDPVDTYNPDIVGDIHALPFADNTIDSFVCMSVLEHVEDPALASREMLRALRPGGRLLLYVPFLFYYHAEKGYYQDYWRFSEDAIRLLLKDFSSVEIEPTRGAIETVCNLLPFGSRLFIRGPARLLDRLCKKTHSRQTAGYHAFAVK